MMHTFYLQARTFQHQFYSLPTPRSPDPHINIPAVAAIKLLAAFPDKALVADLAEAKSCGL